MLKFAHSLSIAFGFMVACVQSACGIEKSADAQYCFSASEGGAISKICAQVFKSLSQNAASTRRCRPLDISADTAACVPIFAESDELETGAPIAPEFIVPEHVPNFVKPLETSRAHPIRAPAAA